MIFFNKKEDKNKLKIEFDSLQKAQKLLDERYEKKAISYQMYQAQSIEFSKKIEKLRKKLGDDLYN